MRESATLTSLDVDEAVNMPETPVKESIFASASKLVNGLHVKQVSICSILQLTYIYRAYVLLSIFA